MKGLINSVQLARKIVEYFGKVGRYLSRKRFDADAVNLSWLPRGREVELIVVHEGKAPPAYIKVIERAGIKVIPLAILFRETVNHMRKRRGIKEEMAVTRFIHFLIANNMLK
mgnify:CR=1 FL=1